MTTSHGRPRAPASRSDIAPDRIRRSSDAKRAHIVDAGRRVIFRDGVWSATTRKIAEEASINLATIHYHFKDKESLLVAVYAQMLESLRESVRIDFEKPSTLAERVRRTIFLSWEYSKANMSGQLMQSELTAYALRREGLEWLARRQFDEYLALYAGVFRDAIDVRGRTNLDIEGLSRIILATTDGLLIQHFVKSDMEISSKMFQKLTVIALRYPLTDGATPLTPLTLGPLRKLRHR